MEEEEKKRISKKIKGRREKIEKNILAGRQTEERSCSPGLDHIRQSFDEQRAPEHNT